MSAWTKTGWWESTRSSFHFDLGAVASSPRLRSERRTGHGGSSGTAVMRSKSTMSPLRTRTSWAGCAPRSLRETKSRSKSPKEAS
ncbi:MAG: hypothetical protein QM765_26215 [Myxococcales bacterium]